MIVLIKAGETSTMGSEPSRSSNRITTMDMIHIKFNASNDSSNDNCMADPDVEDDLEDNCHSVTEIMVIADNGPIVCNAICCTERDEPYQPQLKFRSLTKKKQGKVFCTF